MKRLMSANWKMFKTSDEARETATELVELIQGNIGDDREVLVIPPFTAIEAVAEVFKGVDGLYVGAQNFYPAEEGAFTGEISVRMLKALGVEFALAGHSERRHVLNESEEFVGLKTAFGLQAGLTMILCVGEKIEERRAGKVEEVLARQLDAGLKDVPSDVAAEKLVIAYEPVWAIGTGEVAGPDEIVDAHNFLRKKINLIFPEVGNKIRLLYGGSVKPDNCFEIISLDNVDGVLVGGASLQGKSFSRIALA